MHHPKLEDLVRQDPRYAYEAYEFTFAALAHTQKLLGRVPPRDGPAEQEYHVSGRELMEGARDLALREFGLMAKTVFHQWGIRKTDDFGEIVFNLIEAGLIGLIANFAGIALGFALSLILIYVINKQSFGWTIRFHWPVAVLLGALTVVYAATVLAGLYPARVAVRLNPIAVVHEE